MKYAAITGTNRDENIEDIGVFSRRNVRNERKTFDAGALRSEFQNKSLLVFTLCLDKGQIATFIKFPS